jgi:hypothetical protein
MAKKLKISLTQLGYRKPEPSSTKLSDPMMLILLMGRNFSVEKIARLGFPIAESRIFSTIISYSIERSSKS